MYTGDSYKQALKVIDGCEKCSLSNFRNNIVKYRGNPKSDIMVVAEAPGAQEDARGIPMVGRTGTYLVNIFNDNGLTLYDDYLITNVVLCRPPGNIDPTPDQMSACAEWLNLQLSLMQPKVVIACGRIAASRLIPQWDPRVNKITREEGNHYYPPHLSGALVVPIRHPSAAERNAAAKPQYEENLARIIAHIKTVVSGS